MAGEASTKGSIVLTETDDVDLPESPVIRPPAMVRQLASALVALLLVGPAVATAQPRRRQPPPPQQPTPPPEEAEPEEEPEAPPEGEEGEGEEGGEGEGEGEGPMQLHAPMLEGGAGTPGAEGQPEGEEGAETPALSPGDAESRLLEQGGNGEHEDDNGPLGPWASKALPLFNLHGYFRTRFELFHQFHMGWPFDSTGVPDPAGPPFARPLESGLRECGEGGDPGAKACDNNTLAGGNLRLRMNPQINVSDEVQINAQIDLLDNLVLGSTPEGYDPDARGITPWAPIRAFSSTQNPPDSRNSLTDAVTVRRAWAQVRTDLGVLRFGRMGSDWGLGVLANGGEGREGSSPLDGLHADYGDIADRVMFATRVAGITIVPIWDFAAEGPTSRLSYDHTGQSYDLSQLDDVNQYILVLARKLDEEDLRDRLQLGQVAVQGGLYLVYRDQLLTSEYADPLGSTPTRETIVRRNAQAWIPDAWLQVQYRKFRFEMEAVLVAGSIENLETGGGYSNDDMTVMQYGGVAQVEYRLMNDKLRIGFEGGLASGDPDIEGLSPNGGLLAQLDDDKTISAFRFDRDFNVDFILWEELMGAVSSAYYFRPNVSYDFINSSLGQLFGARLDVVWSRAMEPVQTRGNSADLGVEFDLQLYYRSEDGPSLTDGFVAGLRYGILIPLAGMNILDDENGGRSLDLSSPQTLQAFLGVVY